LSDLCKDRVVPLNLKPKMTVNELVKEMSKSGCFGAGRLATAVDIYECMLRERATIFLGLSGAMTAAGFRGIITDLIKKRMVDVIVSTGANMVHDALETFGGGHYRGSWLVDDKSLHKYEVDRIYDVFIPEVIFVAKFDKPVFKILRDIAKHHRGNPLGIKDFMWEIGKRMPHDEKSILYNAYKYKVPIFIPAVQDSCFGLSMWEYLFKLEEGGMTVDAFKDMNDFFEIVTKAKKRGAILIGGGVPKNFIFQAAFKTGASYDYAIQITMDRPEPGGLSGATLEEAISWGKVGEKARRVQVISDATICLPILVAAVMERMKKK